MSLQNPLIANEAMYSKEAKDYFYPMTVAKQVLMEDGNRLDAYLNGMVIPNGMELLWENPDPTAEFPAQTLDIDCTKYSYILIFNKWSKGDNLGRTEIVLPNGIRHDMTIFGTGDTNKVARSVTISNNIVFNGGIINNVANNAGCIPLYIYGIKENATIGGESTLLNANMLGNVPAEEYVKKSETGMDLLWENANPTSAFPAQIITLDTSKYSKFIVEAYFDTGNVELTTSFINEKNATYMMSAFRDVGMWIGYRTINITNNAVEFGTPRCQGSDPDAPSWCIPYKIYGIK